MAPEMDRIAYHDEGEVRAAAAALQVSEFNVFELAWIRWFGDEPGTEAIEQWYGPYMSDGAVPHWVRHFCRAVGERIRQGDLDPAEFGVSPRRGQAIPHQVLLYAVLLLAIVIMLFTEAQRSGELLEFGGCFLTPCS